MRFYLILFGSFIAFLPRTSWGQGVTFRANHSVAVVDLAEEGGQGATLPSPEFIPLPAFPPELLRAWVGGDAIVRFHVNEKGLVSEVTVISASAELFGHAALEAVPRWRFGHPALRKTGGPTQLWAKCHFVFKVIDD
jgi:TonB family protein